MTELAQRIRVEQVRVGLYIHLEGWTDHPFLFSRFKVRNEKQVQVLRSLGMTHVLYDPAKSDQPPLPAPAVDAHGRLDAGRQGCRAVSDECKVGR